MKFSVCNLGCKVNAYEAECVAGTLVKDGWQRVSFDEPADACLIFTCAVTNMAAQKSRKMMHQARRRNPEAAVMMVGCYSQINDGRLDDADILLGSGHKKDAPKYLYQFLETHEKIKVLDLAEEAAFEPLVTDTFENRTRAYLKIQDGCNQFCSYCVIPYARGRERSMDPDLAVREIQKLSRSYSEVVLTGIHTGRYGREHGLTLTDLIGRIMRETDLQRLRISSIEITEITDEFLQMMKEEPRIARHLHIPLQSGCDRTLREMNRPYTCDEYYARIAEIRQMIPDIAISCDLIVGFPGESEEDFAKTCAFLKKCAFTFLHVFPYSARTNTPAAARKDQIDPKTKKQRAAVCAAISRELASSFGRSQEGKIAEVIAEQQENGYTKGYTSQYLPVRISGNVPAGKEVQVRLTQYADGCMYAEVVNETDRTV